MNVGFLLTARLKSRRLPKKVILEIAGRPLISHMLDRIKAADRVDEIVICTSTDSQDDPLEKIAESEGVSCYRGSEDDVLARLYEAASLYGIEYIINLTADCPVVDPSFINLTVHEFEETNADYIEWDKLPAGQGPLGLKVNALRKVCDIKKEKDTEVWGYYFTKTGLFHILYPEVSKKFICPDLKTTLDYPEDYKFLKCIFNELYIPNKVFSLDEIIKIVKEKPELMSINRHCMKLCKDHISRTAPGITLKKKYSGITTTF